MTTADFEAMGLRHWQKNGMDRIYINLSMDAVYGDHDLYHWLNRSERMNHKFYWDCVKNELIIDNVGNDDAREAIVGIVTSMIAK